jgi:pentatricopeptide repeat protein
MIETGCDDSVFIASRLFDIYAKCGSMEDACGVFNRILLHKVVSWSAIILGHVKCEQGQKAVELFQ